MKKVKILLTGGHAATTGIAVVEEIKKTTNLKDAEIYWIGAKTAIEGSKFSTMESQIFPKIGVKFIPIMAGKLQTKFTIHTIPSILKIPVGFIQAFWLLIKIRPSVTLSFGGYSSFPVVFWSWFFRIPVILHEQTVVAGRASISSSFFATKIALARKESLRYFPKDKTIVIGNPLMTNILNVKPKTHPDSPATILVIGGSRGSNFINELVMDIGKTLLSRFKIIHITGEKDFEMIEKYRDSLSPVLNQNYKTLSSVDPMTMGRLYSQSDLIISRSGANSVSEILYVKRPAILIPLPRTFMGEQVKNAQYAKDFGLSSVFLEKEATPSAIIIETDRLLNDWQKIETKVSEKVSPDVEASKKVVNILQEYI
jgi:UDP-N-acetylglucosamine--N-acetylmuramyl-(pentapeptide) pyrophosphoryl-undecaprenol N-acetylglucosamine transferase